MWKDFRDEPLNLIKSLILDWQAQNSGKSINFNGAYEPHTELNWIAQSEPLFSLVRILGPSPVLKSPLLFRLVLTDSKYVFKEETNLPVDVHWSVHRNSCRDRWENFYPPLGTVNSFLLVTVLFWFIMKGFNHLVCRTWKFFSRDPWVLRSREASQIRLGSAFPLKIIIGRYSILGSEFYASASWHVILFITLPLTRIGFSRTHFLFW